MAVKEERLASYVQPELSPARIARLWSGVSGRLRPAGSRRASRWLVRGAAIAALGATAVGAAVVGPHLLEPVGPSSAWKNASLETAGDTLAVALDDGSKLKLESQTRLDVQGGDPAHVTLNLRRGRVACDVVHKPGRSFSVLAEGVEVRVIGTRFSVALESGHGDKRVAVHVERGSVEVRTPNEPDDVRRLVAGESWSITTHASEPVQARPEPSAEATLLGPGSNTAPVAPRPGPSAVSIETASARQLLEIANAARRSGDVREAASAYESLVRRHPSDSRAGLAAFELGRLRMDRLGDMKGAIQALNRAIQLAPGSGFREDALARLTQAYASVGADDRCRQTRDLYLKSFPNGVHAASVTKRCASR
jgi:TolA-binding protein